ncbi:MAG: hypothetical protein H6745_19085 [Deltaproteobacteria bacterium]|nr:hypothetical protein [Deltaproteobacteria bacterium]
MTSLEGLQALSGSQSGFGGDLRYGEEGAGAGLRGADKICAELAEMSMPGAGAKGWHAFLSAYETSGGQVVTNVDAIDRVGDGPWYDRLGRLVASTKANLIATRPVDADSAIINDLPNEWGVPNHRPDPTQGQVDNHDTLTGSNSNGRLYSTTATCNGWTSVSTSSGKPRVGHSWPRSGGPGGGGGGGGDMNPAHWISSLNESGCKAGINLIETGPPGNDGTVGSGGGYGGWYCFADIP